MELIRDRVKVQWVELGEGWDGNYDPDDPEDEELLRFDVLVRAEYDPNGWEELESYCTQFPVSAPDELKEKALHYIMDFVHDDVMQGFSIRKIAERLSWISPETVSEKE